MKNPKVTIVIPVYNGKKYMKEAIDSALGQTYSNLEVLVINDGSNDNGATRNIAKSYGKKIKYIEKENGGVSTVLNLALKTMTGEYFSWLSHDDVYYPSKIEEEVNYLIENNCLDKKVILYSDYELIDEKGVLISKAIKDHEMLVRKEEYALLRGTVNGITLLIPTFAFDECGNFDEKLRCVQDYELWYRMMKKGYKFIHIPKILAKSRFHRKQVTNTNPKVITEGNDFWIYMIDDISDKKKEELEGSVYNYYVEMESFLKDTPYEIAMNHCHDICNEMESNVEKQVEKFKVSVIIPFYNRSDLVIRAINSVLNQTHSNFEILVINDGSTDNISKVKKIVKSDKRIHLVNLSSNKGAANARNIGIDKSTGDYVAFLDSDDVFEKDKLKIQLTKMVLNKSNVSHTSYYRNGFSDVVLFHSGKQTGVMIPTLIWSCQIATPTVMIRREYLNRNHYRFNPNLVIGEDTCFWITILLHENLLGIDIPLTTVYSNENSAAYNVEKQIIGMKTILKFVLENDNLNFYDYEISLLASYYINFVNQLNQDKIVNIQDVCCPNCMAMLNSKSWKITKPLRLMSKFLKSLRHDGISTTFKKVYKKVKGK